MVLVTPEEMTTDDASFVDKLYSECPEMRTVQTLALDFTQVLRDRNSQHLNDWIEQAKVRSIPELVNFVNALCRDRAAVVAALTLDISNGQVEGQENHLKLIKRSGGSVRILGRTMRIVGIPQVWTGKS
jgi:transposase